MLATITLITAFSFAAIYPFCFWISYKDPLKNGFHKFHLGLPNTIGGVVLVFIWLMEFPLPVKIIVTVWKAAFLSVSSYSWKKEFPKPGLVLIPCLLGVYGFISVQAHMIGPGWKIASAGIISGSVFCASLYAMNLGHWYLNVHGLPIKHLMNSVNVFWAVLGARAVWDAGMLATGTVMYSGELIPLTDFIARSDGFLLMIGLFFGTFFPMITLYFVREVLKLKNTQSATGILYVILCSVLLGDLTYKYYLVKFGIPL